MMIYKIERLLLSFKVVSDDCWQEKNSKGFKKRLRNPQAIGWHPIIEAIPSNSNPKMGQKDEIVWLDSPNHRFSIKVAWEQLRRHRQMVEWHDIVWFKNVVPRHSFLLWMADSR